MPLAIIIILILAAIMCVASKNTKRAKTISMVSLAVCAAISVIITGMVMSGGDIIMVMGNEPFNISLKVGLIECFMSCLFTIIGFFIIWASLSMISHDVEEDKIPLFYFLMLALIGTLCAVVFLIISSLYLYLLSFPALQQQVS